MYNITKPSAARGFAEDTLQHCVVCEHDLPLHGRGCYLDEMVWGTLMLDMHVYQVPPLGSSNCVQNPANESSKMRVQQPEGCQSQTARSCAAKPELVQTVRAIGHR